MLGSPRLACCSWSIRLKAGVLGQNGTKLLANYDPFSDNAPLLERSWVQFPVRLAK